MTEEEVYPYEQICYGNETAVSVQYCCGYGERVACFGNMLKCCAHAVKLSEGKTTTCGGFETSYVCCESSEATSVTEVSSGQYVCCEEVKVAMQTADGNYICCASGETAVATPDGDYICCADEETIVPFDGKYICCPEGSTAYRSGENDTTGTCCEAGKVQLR